MRANDPAVLKVRATKRIAGIMNDMQMARHELISMATSNPDLRECKDIISLANLMRKANDAIKDDFCRLTN